MSIRQAAAQRREFPLPEGDDVPDQTPKRNAKSKRNAKVSGRAVGSNGPCKNVELTPASSEERTNGSQEIGSKVIRRAPLTQVLPSPEEAGHQTVDSSCEGTLAYSTSARTDSNPVDVIIQLAGSVSPAMSQIVAQSDAAIARFRQQDFDREKHTDAMVERRRKHDLDCQKQRDVAAQASMRHDLERMKQDDLAAAERRRDLLEFQKQKDATHLRRLTLLLGFSVVLLALALAALGLIKLEALNQLIPSAGLVTGLGFGGLGVGIAAKPAVEFVVDRAKRRAKEKARRLGSNGHGESETS
jgi:hypothetical protein